MTSSAALGLLDKFSRAAEPIATRLTRDTERTRLRQSRRTKEPARKPKRLHTPIALNRPSTRRSRPSEAAMLGDLKGDRHGYDGEALRHSFHEWPTFARQTRAARQPYL